MVLVVASDHLPKPFTDLTGAIVLAALKLSLNGFQLRNHALLRSDPPDGEGLGLVALPTVVGEPQEVEGLRFPFPTLLPVTGRIAPELDQPTLIPAAYPYLSPTTGRLPILPPSTISGSGEVSFDRPPDAR
jgi:hypothetical protein